jgi:hypothetical protein
VIFAYNKQNVGDTLMVIVKNDENKEKSVERLPVFRQPMGKLSLGTFSMFQTT